jgi:undecaprenyl-diphosphatase
VPGPNLDDMSTLTYAEAIVVGALQGVTELFPVSSLGHSVLIPAIVGGSWARDLNVSAPESPYLAFIVGLHVATALALLLLFRRDWARIVRGFFTSLRHRSISTADERLAWLVIIATVPVGLTGLVLEHTFRTTLGRPTPAAVFLTLNGGLLLAGEWLRRRAASEPATRLPVLTPAPVSNLSTTAEVYGSLGWTHLDADPDIDSADLGDSPDLADSAELAGPGDSADPFAPTPPGTRPDDVEIDTRLSGLSWRQALLTGATQSLALLPGISRSGVTMVAGLAQGLTHEEAVRLSFLLATPVILAAGVLKVPDLAGPLGSGIHGQILAGSLAAFVCAYLAARFLTRWFSTRTLTPFAIYCLLAGPVSLLLINR